MNRPRIMFYHDARHCHLYRYEPPMFREEYVAMVDELAGTPVEAINFTLGEGRTMLHDTCAGELMGHNVEVWDHQVFRRAAVNAKGLIDRGQDPLRILCERAAELSILIYPTLTVQGPGPDHASVRCSDFRKKNQHLEIGDSDGVDPDHPSFSCLDFKHPETRDERFAIAEEVVNEYDVGGFELQLNILPYYFHPDEVETGRAVMTDWVGRVYEAVKKSGVERELVVHLPDRLEDCQRIGLDPEEWVRRGIVDALVPEMFAQNYYIKMMADYGEFIRLAAGSSCRILAPVNSMLTSDRMLDAPLPMIRAQAVSAWDQGVDGLYVNEWFHLWPYEAEFYEKLRELPYPSIMDSGDKFYYVPTNAQQNRMQSDRNPLPARMDLNRPVEVDVRIADDLPHWGTMRRVHEVLLRLRILGNNETDAIDVGLNGRPLPDRLRRKINYLYTMDGPRYRVMGGYWHIYRLEVEHWPRKGSNALQVVLRARDGDLDEQFCTVTDVELEIKYLKGKNFHRSYVDADLGPYDHRT